MGEWSTGVLGWESIKLHHSNPDFIERGDSG
jgi:hypothetical protein